MNKQNVWLWVVNFAVIAALLIVTKEMFHMALEKSDKIYCKVLHKQSEQYVLWFATPIEREMCMALNMELPPDNMAYPDGQPWPYYKSEIK